MSKVPIKKQASWCRAEVPDDLRVTFVASKSEDALLHSYLGSLRFGSASKEVRRLLSFAIRNIDVPDRGAAPFVLPVEPVLPTRIAAPPEESQRTLRVTEPVSLPPLPLLRHSEPVADLAKIDSNEQATVPPKQDSNKQETRSEVPRSSSAQITEEDLRAISLLDSMSGD